MKPYIKFITVLTITLLCPVIVHSQTLRPSYLSEMPAPTRIRSEIKGKDEEDAGERQLGAFVNLIKMIEDMAYGVEHRSARQLTPDEQRMQATYSSAYTELWHAAKNKFGKEYAGSYDRDRDLLVEVLDKFFSPNFRTQYLKTNGFAAAWYQKVHANGPTSVPGGTSNVTNNRATVGSAPGPDPSIAKARAANVDTTVYGMQLGDPLRLPTCPSMFDVPSTCFYEDSGITKELGEFLGGAPGPKTNEQWKLVFVRKGPKASVLLYNGVLVAVKFETGGINSDPEWSKQLREKYGPPSAVKPFTYTPRIGNVLKANDLEWRLPGLHVEYNAVLKKQNSSEVLTIDGGSVTVETETAYQRRIAEEKEQQKGRTKF